MMSENQGIGAERESRWYATYLCPRHEKSVARQLEERKVDCFLPTYRSVRRWKDRRREIELALFPGYIFVRIPQRDRLRVLTLPGVVRFVSFGGEPATLADAEMDSLRRGLSEVSAEPHPYLKIGRRVRVIRGPFSGTQGILIRKKDKYRVVLSIDVIMRAVAVEIDSSDVAPI